MNPDADVMIQVQRAAAAQDAAERARAAAARGISEAVRLAHRAGHTYEAIGAAIGVSAQRASFLANRQAK